MNPVFARIIKVDEETRTVTGRAAQEVVDRDNEIFDYASSKPEFMKWSAEVSADTGGKSLGNVRSMHGNIAAGKLTNIDFNDVEKSIDISAKIIDDNEWDKVIEGVHTGFSIGGRYARKWAEPINGKMIQRYTAVPNEISIVDRPCCPTAKFFSIHKRDGSIVQKAQVTTDDLVKFEDGKFVFKGGSGSGPHGGGSKPGNSAKLAMFSSSRATRESNRSSTKTSAKATQAAHDATKNATKEGTYGAHATAAEAHEHAADAHTGKNAAASFAHSQAAQLHTEAMFGR